MALRLVMIYIVIGLLVWNFTWTEGSVPSIADDILAVFVVLFWPLWVVMLATHNK